MDVLQEKAVSFVLHNLKKGLWYNELVWVMLTGLGGMNDKVIESGFTGDLKSFSA